MRELKANQLIRELTTPLKIKPRLVVKITHTELLLLSESLETKAKLKKIAKQDTKKNSIELETWSSN